MIENLVAAWLTEASERSYEAAFAQLLAIEGHSVIQGPMHHAHEHGKDIIAYNPDGQLCVYQLKGGSRNLDIEEVKAVQAQLFTAAASIVNHPSLDRQRLPDHVYLVTNQPATGPAQGRIRVLSEGNVVADRAPLHLIEGDELQSRFVRAQGRFFPSSPGGLKAFLALFLSDGCGPVPQHEFFALLSAVLPVAGKRPRALAAQREISSAALTVAFALRPWTELDNHAEVAMGWIYFCSQVLRVAQRLDLAEARWTVSYRLGLEETRRRLRLLLAECLEAKDLAIGHPAEPLVYGARATKVCGLVSAALLSEQAEFGREDELRSKVHTLLRREARYVRVVCEYQAPAFLLTVRGLSETGEIRLSTQMLFAWIGGVARANERDSSTALPNPYYSTEAVLLGQIAPFETEGLQEEQFAGYSYTLHVVVRWAARRLWRQTLASLWDPISRVERCSFEPSQPLEYLYHHSPRGDLRTWRYGRPTKWSDLLAEARSNDFSRLPKILVERTEFVPFYCLAFPHRFTPAIGDLLDSV